jgi:phage host-nuclease inhibitor protein Gam
VARPRKASNTLESIEECRTAMRTLLIATTNLEKVKAEKDAAVARLGKTYERDMARFVEEKADIELQLQQYYMAHLSEVEREGKKSIDLQYGVMGRWLGKPTLKLLNKAWTWAASLVKLRESFGNRFLRMPDPEINKDLVKAEIAAEQLGEFGLKIHQEEDFYVDLNRSTEGA